MKTFDEAFSIVLETPDSFVSTNIQSVLKERMSDTKWKNLIMTEATSIVADVISATSTGEDRVKHETVAKVCATLSALMEAGVLIGREMEKVDF